MTEHVESLREHADRVGREPTHTDLLRAVDRTAAQDRADRADQGLGPLVEARDFNAAGGRFGLADSQQKLIDACRAKDTAREQQVLVCGPFLGSGREGCIERD